jgi:hypothetical protein
MVPLLTRLREALRLSPKARLALALGSVAAVVVIVAAVFFLPSATLTVFCRHDFRRGEITVSVDDDELLADTLTGGVSRKWLGMVEKTGGTYTRSVSVGAGRRVVEVHLRAPGYDRTRRIEGGFRRGEESVLAVDSGRDLALSWRASAPPGGGGGEPVAARSEAAAGWGRYAGSILFTILGSIVSASIGVFVQDFLRSRKARKAEAAKPAVGQDPPAAS